MRFSAVLSFKTARSPSQPDKNHENHVCTLNIQLLTLRNQQLEEKYVKNGIGWSQFVWSGCYLFGAKLLDLRELATIVVVLLVQTTEYFLEAARA